MPNVKFPTYLIRVNSERAGTTDNWQSQQLSRLLRLNATNGRYPIRAQLAAKTEDAQCALVNSWVNGTMYMRCVYCVDVHPPRPGDTLASRPKLLSQANQMCLRCASTRQATEIFIYNGTDPQSGG